MSDETKIIELKVPFKKPVPDDRFLLVEYNPCFHGPFVVDRDKLEVVCKKCGEKLNPMHVLCRLASEETQWHESFKRYQGEMKRLAERSATKCQHCQKMTRISHA